ncbi:MAG: RNB domain-containing ribonuclease [Opitutaceae bacterium]|nr:RNB domain-containing ribonuclease [Opitutaceae bacterium]
MPFRDRLLALLRDAAYSPVNEFEISRRLDLKKKDRGQLTHEIRLLLRSGEFRREPTGRIARAATAPAAAPRAAQSRGVFTPSRRGPALPPPSAQGVDPLAFSPPAKQPHRSSGRASDDVATLSRHGRRGRETSAPARPQVAPPATAPRPPASSGELAGRIQFRAGGTAFVVLESDPSGPAVQVFPEDTGLALPGDRVAVRLHRGRKGRRPGEQVGAVVRVLERGRETIVGDLRAGRRGYVVVPDDPRFSHEIRVDDPADSDLTPAPRPGDKVVVRLGIWRHREDALTGVITERLGRTHEPQAELRGIFIKYDLATQFPADVEREAAALPDRVPARDTTGRLDYRDIPVFTIDPDDAKDFDDALSYEALAHGAVRIGIHIADVSSYVPAGTALDREAQRRGNSTYLVGVVVPMLPEKLSNGLCSLVEAQDRLCKAVFLTFDRKGHLSETTYANTVIRSRKRLTYKQAYALLFEDDLQRIRDLPLPPKHQTGSTGRALRELSEAELRDLQGWVRALWKIAARLRKDRMAHGSLDLDMPETKIFVDEKGYADRLEKIEHDESHQLIEEFMLAANEAVARLTRTRRLPSLYRVHDDPDPAKLSELRDLLASFNIKSGDLTRRQELVRILAVLHAHPQGYTLRTQLLRSLKKAAYRHTPDGHFGLAKHDYTHFTSPIRRYSDLVVHRVLGAHLAKSDSAAPAATGYTIGQVERMGEHLSLTEVNSTEAERDSVKVKLLEFFERELDKSPKTRFEAIITDVRANGFFIELIESMTFGFVPASALGDDHFWFDEESGALVGRRRKKRYELNGRLPVVVDSVDRFKRVIDFRPV